MSALERPTSATRPRLPWLGRTALLLALVLLTVLLALGLGSVRVSAAETLRGVWHGLSGAALTGNDVIVWQLRFPRVALGLLVGASLGVCGAAYQGVFRNPLADPYLMGVASGAGLGATLAVVAGWNSALIPLSALLGALLSVLLSLALARQGRTLPPLRLILSGVVVGSILTAASTYLLLTSPTRILQVYSFTLGSLTFGGWHEVGTVLPYALLGGGLLLLLARALNVLQLGDLTARSLGLPVERLRLLVILAASLVTAAAVSYAGIIGFVGLVTPHLVRRLWGPDYRLLLPISALAGAGLLVLSDLLARTLTATELPVGVVTTLLGGPFFLYLLRRQGGER
ncbi:FecCD family ABC transporter permease [Deinococcus ruber]|uniref:Iron ABC transporter permease n=1 Tax=Deinococcus ruber TaxID=1848197 RepID=A0A918FD04_9DEIO|nr:iron ABC transporter permease [Deinococcus ruber]GGR28496.1 iron ABC transporter permease [Deinococcus ruber]